MLEAFIRRLVILGSSVFLDYFIGVQYTISTHHPELFSVVKYWSNLSVQQQVNDYINYGPFLRWTVMQKFKIVLTSWLEALRAKVRCLAFLLPCRIIFIVVFLKAHGRHLWDFVLWWLHSLEETSSILEGKGLVARVLETKWNMRGRSQHSVFGMCTYIFFSVNVLSFHLSFSSELQRCRYLKSCFLYIFNERIKLVGKIICAVIICCAVLTILKETNKKKPCSRGPQSSGWGDWMPRRKKGSNIGTG